MTARSWPVSFHPQRDELLYSWLARVAGVYGLFPHDLLPERETFELANRLVYEANPNILKSLAARSGISVKVLAKRTLAGANPPWPPSWWLAHFGTQTRPLEVPEPSLQVCPRCMAEDARSGDGIAFLRLRWQCSASTICQRHLIALKQACIHCHSVDWPVCERSAFHRYHFVCVHCGSRQEEEGADSFTDAGEAAVRLLARFETQLHRALANRAVDWCWIGHATAKDFLRLVEDLLWALTRCSFQSRPIYRLQTSAFPFCERSLQASVVYQWRCASPNVRRCLLAAVLNILAAPQRASLLQGRLKSPFRWPELLSCLNPEYKCELQRRSWFWPPAAHNAFRRAAGAPRDRLLFQAMARPLSTDIGKLSSAFRKVY